MGNTLKTLKSMEIDKNELKAEGMNFWPDSVRFKMIEKSNFYQQPQYYQYGFYDGYQLQNEKIKKAIELIQKARTSEATDYIDDRFLQDAIIALLK